MQTTQQTGKKEVLLGVFVSYFYLISLRKQDKCFCQIYPRNNSEIIHQYQAH